jgi:hypothetical protein
MSTDCAADVPIGISINRSEFVTELGSMLSASINGVPVSDNSAKV